MSDVITAMVRVRPLRSEAAALLRLYPRRLATCRTRSAVSAFTGQSSSPFSLTFAFITKETSVTETPASSATSRMVVFFIILYKLGP